MGGWLTRLFDRDQVLATGYSRAEGDLVRVDLSDLEAVCRLVKDFKPHLIFLCAAMTSPAQCQAEPEAAWAVNAVPAAALARLGREMGFRLVFVSSDLVFDGAKGNYVETDEPAPLSIYGQTKAAAERAVLATEADVLVARTSLIIGGDGSGPAGQLAWLEAQMKAGLKTTLFVDEFRSPIAAAELAQAFQILAQRGRPGLWHLAGRERMSRFALGRLIHRALGWPEENLQPGRHSDVKCDPPRPRDVSLNVDKALSLLGPKGLRPLSEALGGSLRRPVG